MKYIRHKLIGFVLFEESQIHKEIMNYLKILPEDIMSAGEVRLVDGHIHCFGESMTLCRSAREGDSEALQRQLDAFPQT